MLTQTRRAGCWLVVVSTATVLSACGGGHDRPRSLAAIPQPLTPAGTSAAASAPSQVSESPSSDQAAATTVVQRYFRASNRLAHTMSPAPLGRLMARSCPCRAQIASVRTAQQRGEVFTGRATIHALRASVTGPTTATVLADYAFSRGGLVDARGHHLTVIKPRSHVHWLFALRRIRGCWKITRIGAA